MIKAFKISKLRDWRFKVSHSESVALTFNDWFLPSLDELQAMYDELYLNDLGNFVNIYYYTSSEVDSYYAFGYDFGSGISVNIEKGNETLIRPIRQFTAAAGAYSLRQEGPAGGLIFIVDGTTYFECALEDLAPSAWSDIVDQEIGTTGTDIGTGYQNTLDIINQTGHINSAAQLAYNYSVSVLTTGLGNWKFKITQLLPWRFKVTEVDRDSVAPTLLTAILTDNFTLALTFNEALNESIVPDYIDFVYAQNVTGITIAGAVVTLTFTTEILYSDTDQIAYIPGANRLQDLAGNEVAAFSSDVDNSIFPNGSCSDLLLSAATADGFRADWINGSTDETAIIIEISTDNITFVPETLAAGTEFKEFTGKDASTLYYVRVRAVKNGFPSAYTDTESITTASGEEAETTIYVNAMTTPPSTGYRTAYNNLIKGLKDDGVFALGDCLWLRSVHDSQAACLNMIKRLYDSTLVNAPSFTPKLGFTGNGISSYINNNFIPKANKVNFAYNSGSIVSMDSTMGNVNNAYLYGVRDNALFSRLLVQLKTAANEEANFCSYENTGLINITAGKYAGYTRTGNTVQGYVDGAATGATSTASVNLEPNLNFVELAANLNGSIAGYYNGTRSFLWIGGLLNVTKMAALYNRMAAYQNEIATL